MTTRAAIYLRISLDAAMDGLAIDRQRQDCEALALVLFPFVFT